MPACRLKRIIVNADDLGESLAINDAIFSRIESGKITSATILANGAAVADAVNRCHLFPKASFGVHLNATDGAPLAPTPGLNPILNESGCFDGDKLRRVPVDSTLREALYVEWAAQISRLIHAGVPVSHFDGHHHIHTTPGVFRVVKRLQRHFGIRKVRISRNLYSESTPPRTGSLLWKKSIWNFALRFIPPFTITTQYFTSLEAFAEMTVKRIPQGELIELMVHPGNPIYAVETALLDSPWVDVLPFAVKFLSWNEI